MSAIKEFYHEEICRGNEVELQKAMDLDAQLWAEEDAQIIARGEEMIHSEMPNFLR
jgi:hypothetical protein